MSEFWIQSDSPAFWIFQCDCGQKYVSYIDPKGIGDYFGRCNRIGCRKELLKKHYLKPVYKNVHPLRSNCRGLFKGND